MQNFTERKDLECTYRGFTIPRKYRYGELKPGEYLVLSNASPLCISRARVAAGSYAMRHGIKLTVRKVDLMTAHICRIA